MMFFLTTILQHRCYIVGSQSKPLSSSSSVGVGPLPVPPSLQVVQQPITRIPPSCWLDRWIVVFANVCLSFAKNVKWTELCIHFNPSCKYLSCVFETSALRSSLQVPTLIWVWLVFWRGSSQFCRLRTILQVGYFFSNISADPHFDGSYIFTQHPATIITSIAIVCIQEWGEICMIMQSHRDQRAAELQKKVSHGPRQEEHTSSVFHELYKSVESHDLSKTVPFHELYSLFIAVYC